MNKFLISSDDCLILKAFKDSESLREAAQLLGCDPAGLARRVQSISSEFGFLHKVKNRWQLTPSGLDLVAWTEASIESQKKVLSGKSRLHVGSTMWFSEEVLIPNLNKLKGALDLSAISLSVPDKGFERALLEGSVHFVIVCHPPENPDIEHKKVGKEEWVLIAPKSWPAKDLKDLNLLKKRPFIHHSSINPDLYLVDLGEVVDSGISIDNLIGVRAAVTMGLGWSLVPRFLVKHHLKLQLISEIPYALSFQDRHVCVWWLRHRHQIRRQAHLVCNWAKEIL